MKSCKLINPRLNALIESTDPRQGLQAADEADGMVARGERVGAAHGLPVAVKDVVLVTGRHAPAAVPPFERSQTTTRPSCHGYGPKARSWSRFRDFSHLMVHNLTGWPTVVVRCGTSRDSLPVGVQIAARPWQDPTALAVAR